MNTDYKEDPNEEANREKTQDYSYLAPLVGAGALGLGLGGLYKYYNRYRPKPVNPYRHAQTLLAVGGLTAAGIHALAYKPPFELNMRPFNLDLENQWAGHTAIASNGKEIDLAFMGEGENKKLFDKFIETQKARKAEAQANSSAVKEGSYYFPHAYGHYTPRPSMGNMQGPPNEPPFGRGFGNGFPEHPDDTGGGYHNPYFSPYSGQGSSVPKEKSKLRRFVEHSAKSLGIIGGSYIASKVIPEDSIFHGPYNTAKGTVKTLKEVYDAFKHDPDKRASYPVDPNNVNVHNYYGAPPPPKKKGILRRVAKTVGVVGGLGLGAAGILSASSYARDHGNKDHKWHKAMSAPINAFDKALMNSFVGDS